MLLRSVLVEMASLADSAAHFDARAAEYQVPDALRQQLIASGIKTLGQLAFAFARPGQEYTDQQFVDWLREVNTWRITPVSKWLVTMVSKSPKWGYSPFKLPKWLINGGY